LIADINPAVAATGASTKTFIVDVGPTVRFGVPAAVALADSVTLFDVKAEITAFAGIPVPVTGAPTVNPDVEIPVIVALPLVTVPVRVSELSMFFTYSLA
jgi:hypothetical protein